MRGKCCRRSGIHGKGHCGESWVLADADASLTSRSLCAKLLRSHCNAAGCGGAQPPIGAPGGPSSALAHKEQNLLYISDEQASDVYMVALPSGKLVGKLTGFNYASGDCTDEHGNVFVGNLTEGQVRGYAHGAKSAFRVLNDPSWWP